MVGVENGAFQGELACRFCAAPLTERVADLGASPLSNDYVKPGEPETLFPLVAFVCGRCFLVQVPAVVSPERIFGDYAYMSSYSVSWLEHVRRYCATMVDRLGVGGTPEGRGVRRHRGPLPGRLPPPGGPRLG